MPFHLRNSRIPKPTRLPKPAAARNDGLFIGAAAPHSPDLREVPLRHRPEAQGKQVDGSSLPMYFLLDSFANSRLNRLNRQIPSLLPHPTSLFALQESLPLVNSFLCLKFETLSFCFTRFRPFCKYAGSDSSDSEIEIDGEKGSFEADRKEVERVCGVIDETFAVDRNMEAVLDKCGIDLSHELVLCVLHRFKHARKPAFRFFCWAAEQPGYAHDSRTYNAMVAVLGKTRQFESMVSVLEEMGEKSFLSMETFIICIKAFASAKERRKAVGILDLMKKYRFKIGVEAINCLLDALGRGGLGKEAQELFEKLEYRFTPDLKTYTILLNGWCRARNLMEAGRMWNGMIDNGFKPDIVAHNIMLEGLLRGRKRSEAIKLFEVMKSRGPFPNVRSYTVLINDLCKHGNTTEALNEAMNYLDDMLNSGCEPDAAVYTCLMIGFGNQRKMDMVYRLLKEMKERGCPPDGRSYNTLIKMMTNQKMPDDAAKIYKKMIQSSIQPSIHTYNMIMKSFFVTSNPEMGCAVWEEMKRKGCCPDENSYTVLIGGLIRQGRSNEACKHLEEMIDKGMKAPQLDYKKIAAYFTRRRNSLDDFAEKARFSGNSEVANIFADWPRR
ncbi:Pentatricopeptide repeat superfamily protein [Perilla frutescens var. frutescens]|nr:Pentatricopeptide repeat superfamily protein [Perilla frutescens var. frutescens]